MRQTKLRQLLTGNEAATQMYMVSAAVVYVKVCDVMVSTCTLLSCTTHETSVPSVVLPLSPAAGEEEPR